MRAALERLNLHGLLSRRADLLLAAMVVGVVAMMIVPLPTPLLDVLITTNIASAVILLLVSIYVDDALRIAAFPSILLLATLFRLGLNVSSTRLILLQADAGEVIRSFGNFVVSGNLVVGAVVFLILTIIQFVVIAKGGERVAEVAARFALDAMPGKQMAIDADLRSGSIDLQSARQLRASLQRESQLYGAMDGAMKFVKGDAIAAILITIINIVGGLSIGVGQRDLALGDAAALYSLLTIGDGLVSQIPALLVSIAAGIVVTRVASEDEGAHLGADIGSQILAFPRAIALAAVLLAALAIIPGLPTIPFLALAALAGSVAYGLHRAAARFPARSLDTEAIDQADARPEDAALPSLVSLEVGAQLTPLVDASQGDAKLIRELLPALREMMQSELGVLLPGVQVRQSDELPPTGYKLLLSDVPLAGGQVDLDNPLVLASAPQLRQLGLEPVELSPPPPGVTGPACQVPAAATPRIDQPVVDASTQIALHLGEQLRFHAHELVGIQETQQLLDALERTHPALVHEIVPKIVSLQTLCDILQRLLEEGIAVRNLRDILGALAEWAPGEKDTVVLTEHVRAAMRRYISHKYAGEESLLQALLLDPLIEDTVRESIQRTPRGSYLALEPELGREINAAVRAELRQLDGQQLVVLTTMEIRRYVRRMLEADFPQLPVLSYNELLPSVSVQPMARVGVEH